MVNTARSMTCERGSMGSFCALKLRRSFIASAYTRGSDVNHSVL